MVSQLYQKFTQPPTLFDARLSGEFANIYSFLGTLPGFPLVIANGGTNSGTALNNNRVMKSAGGAIVEASAITAARALISDANGIPTQSVTTSAELAFVNGVTSAIQTQLNGKEPTVTKGNLSDVGTDGIVIGNGASAVIGSGTTITQHVSDSSHNGYLTSTDWSTFNGKQAAGNYVTALTGDVTATGPGSVAATLATVNASPGATTISSVTTNGKGLVTANSSATTTGSGSVVLATGPTLSAPLLGTPASGVLTNCTGTASGLTAGNVTTNANLTGPITSVGNATSIASQTGTGTKFVVDTSPVLVTPNIGTPSAGTLTSCTGLPPSGISAVAWSTYTPTVTAQVGTITTSSASGRYQQFGKTIVFSIKVTITTAGTGNGSLNVSLPVNTQDSLTLQYCGGFEAAVIGHTLYAIISSNQLSSRDYANTTVIQNGAICYFSGTYEAS